MKLNIGCGDKPKKGYTNVDFRKYQGVDVCHDLEKTPLPFKSNSIDKVISEHVMEHIVNFIPLMEDIFRLLKPGGSVSITVPYYNSIGAFQDPTHVRFFTETTWRYFTKNEGIPDYHFKCNYIIKSISFAPNFPKIIRRLFGNLVRSMTVELQKPKQ